MSKAEEIHNEKLSKSKAIKDIHEKYIIARNSSDSERLEGQRLYAESKDLKLKFERWEESGSIVDADTWKKQQDMEEKGLQLMASSIKNQELMVQLNKDGVVLELELMAWRPEKDATKQDLLDSLEGINKIKEVIELIKNKINDIKVIDHSGHIPALEALRAERVELSTAVILGERLQSDLDELDKKIKGKLELVRADNEEITKQEDSLRGLNDRLICEEAMLERKEEIHDTVINAYLVVMAEKKGEEYIKTAKQLSEIDCDLTAITERIGRRGTGKLTYPSYRLDSFKGINLYASDEAAQQKLNDILKKIAA